MQCEEKSQELEMNFSRKNQGSENTIYAQCWQVETVAYFGGKRYRMVK